MIQSPNDNAPFYESIRRYAARIMGNWPDADDVAQETHLRYLKSGNLFQGTQLRNFLYRTARNYMIDIFRKRKRFNKLIEQDSQATIAYENKPAEIQPDQAAQNSEMNSIVRKKVKNLSPQTQEILHLRYDEQMKTKDIAEIIGLSHGNVRRILSEAVAKLAQELT